MPIEGRDNVYLITYTLAGDMFLRLWDVETTQVAFRKDFVKLGRTYGYEIIDGAMETEYVTIQTSLTETTDERVKGLDNVVIINVLRAATPLVEGLLKAFPRAKQGVISAGRDEEAGMDDDSGFPITIGYVKFPEATEKDTAIMAGSMLVTGSTMYSVLDHILENAGVDPGKLSVFSVVSVPDGLLRVDNEFPEIGLLVAVIGDYLDDDSYIIPSPGDVDDRAFRTM